VGVVSRIRFHPKRNLFVTGSSSGHVQLWSADTFKSIGHVMHSHGGNSWLDFSPDGDDLLVCGNNNNCFRWRLRLDSEKPIWTTPAPVDKNNSATRLFGLKFQPDGKTFVMLSSDGGIRVGETATGIVRAPSFFIDERLAASTWFTPDGSLLGCTGDSEFRLWDVETGKIVRHWTNFPEQPFNYFGISPDRRLVVVTGKSKIWVFPWSQESIGEPISIPGEPYGVCFVDSETALVPLATGQIVLVRLLQRQIEMTACTHNGPISSIMVGPHGRTFFTSCFPGIISRWDLRTRDLLPPIVRIGGVFDCDREEKLVAAGDAGTRLADLATGKLVGPKLHRDQREVSLACSPVDDLFLTASSHEIRRWKLPKPTTESLAGLKLRVELATGMRLNAQGETEPLEATVWLERWKQYRAGGKE